jgi:hypothetical protein
MSTVAAVPTISRGSEVDDGVQILSAVTMVCLVSFCLSQDNGDERMETVSSGETPTRNYGRTGDLQMG